MTRLPVRGAAARGRVVPGYRARATAYLRGGRTAALGEVSAGSARLAMRWLRTRAEQVADQLDAPYARPVRAWLGDEREQERALARLVSGAPYAVRAWDDEGTLYALTVEPAEEVAVPVAVAAPGGRARSAGEGQAPPRPVQ